MKKTLKIFAFAVIALAALASCAKDQFKENVIPAGEKIQVSINGQIGEFTSADATKATAESVVRVTWESGEKVFVYDGSADCIGTLDVTRDEKNASYALLSGTITPQAASPSKLTLVYVKGATEAPPIAGGKISIPLSAQDQTEVPFVLYSTIDYATDALSKAEEYITFEFATSVMTVNCTDLPTNEGSKIDITKAEIDGVSTACELAVTGSGVTVAGANPGTITRTETATPSVFTQSDSRGSFKLALAADPAAPAARNILVYQGSKVSGAPFASTTLATSKSYNTVYQLGEYISNAPKGALSGVFTVNADGKKVCFSKGNLYYDGSKFEFEAEQYYFRTYYGNGCRNNVGYMRAFGTAEGHWGLFGWVGASSTTFTSSPEIYGVSTSTTSDDYGNVPGEALKADWGKAIDDNGTWFTLSGGENGEWEYLFAHHVNVWGICNSVPGRFIAPDGFKGDASALSTAVSDWESAQAAGIVFLPAAGLRSGSEVEYVGAGGCYWSSTVYDEFSAYSVSFSSDGVSPVIIDGRYCGNSVRLVTEASGGYSPVVKVTGVTLNKNKTEIEAGAKDTLVATVQPADATNKQVNWSSSDEAVATVDENGEVTGVAAGSAVITATTASGNFTAVCLVTVTSKPLALPGVFSVADGKTVHFSRGNLWYGKVGEATEATFQFEDKQYEFHGYNSANNAWGLFGWSTEKTYYGISTSTTVSDYPGTFVDWGKNIDDKNTWRTLTQAEWEYLINTRTVKDGTKEGHSYQIAYINSTGAANSDVYGMILYPDNYTSQTSATSYTSAEWTSMETAGCVFLPAAGSRDGSDVSNVGTFGAYWSDSKYTNNKTQAYYVYIESSSVSPDLYDNMSNGFSVRLVTEVK